MKLLQWSGKVRHWSKKAFVAGRAANDIRY
jgi:hypothetical protein